VTCLYAQTIVHVDTAVPSIWNQMFRNVKLNKSSYTT